MKIKTLLKKIFFNYYAPKILVTKTIRGKKNRISSRNAFLRRVKFRIIGNANNIVIENSVVLENCNIYINGNNSNVHIRGGCKIKNSSFWIEDDNVLIQIGNRTTIEGAHLAATEDGTSINIGNDCMLAYGIEIRTGDSHSILSKEGERINYAKNVVLGDRIWVAANVTILKGVNIKEDSIIATGSIVTKSFEQSNIIVGGNPARLLKECISWKRERI